MPTSDNRADNPGANRAANRAARKRFAALTAHLRALSRQCGTLFIAYSGGLDSRFLTATTLALGLPVIAVHVNGPHIPAREHLFARQWATAQGFALRLAVFDPLGVPHLARNPKDRCYHCKRAVFSLIRAEAGPDALVLDGTNASDLGEYRPGLRALREAGVLSPLAEAGITKRDVRALALETRLDDPHQAAQPCLLTRFAYGMPVTATALTALDAAEEAVARVLEPDRRVHAERRPPYSTASFRLRFLDDGTAALHVQREYLPDALRQQLEATLAEHGFPHTPALAVSSLSGFFDRAGATPTP